MKALKLCLTMLALCGSGALASQTYSLVQGIDKFEGSASAWRLLETNGFVVADPAYKQIFEPYLDTSLPPFITTDSAWDTYQVLLASAVRPLESRNQPEADFFGKIFEPEIRRGAMPSGLDFLAASPELRSPAATRALRQVSGDDISEAVEKLHSALPPGSLAGQALRLLATLQKPVPEQLAPAFHTEAWADVQLWTQLGAWVEGIVPCPLRAANSEGYEPGDDPSKIGVVAPYPDFFAGLAQLSRQTESAMEKAGMDETFDSRAVAQKLLDGMFIQQRLAAENVEETTKTSPERIQFNQFTGHYMETHHAGGGDNSPAAQQMLKDFEAVARRCATGAAPSAEDKVVLQSFFDERMTAPRLLRDFAATCDKLAELARKQVDGAPLTGDDEKWIASYGMTLARYHLFPDNSSSGGETNLPALMCLGSGAAGASALWAGLGQPEALYIILPAGGRLHLYRGAVLSYRELVRQGSNLQADSPLQAGNTPPPAFTSSFRAEKSAADILETLATESDGAQGFRDIQEIIETLQSRATDSDVPALIGALAKADAAGPTFPVSAGIAAAIAKLNWQPWQNELLALIDKEDGVHADAVVSILLQRPEWLNGAFISANFAHSATHYRRVYALLLGLVPPTEQTRAVLLQALRDDAPSIRWQAVLAVGSVSWDAAQKIPPLLDRLGDTNEFVAAVAARVLGKIGAVAVAPVLFSNLEQRLEAPAPAVVRQEQRAAIQDYTLGTYDGRPNPFDPDNLLARAPMARMRRFGVDVRRDPFTLVTALIEAMGDLHYQPSADTLLGLLAGPNADAAAKALKKLAPGKLSERLIAIAADKNAQPQARDDALLLLSDNAAANPMASLIPLLDDHTIVPGLRMMPGREWRICDRAATTLAALMGRTIRLAPIMPTEQRDDQIEQVRQWLKSAY
jgi:HEAT repeat protein